jgi:SAM-dependent methyltransferase
LTTAKKPVSAITLLVGVLETGVRRKMNLNPYVRTRRSDVRAAYRLILGREPENDSVVLAHAELAGTLEDLRNTFFSSPEFRPPESLAQQMLRPLNWPPMDIELDATPEQLRAIRNHIEENWRQLGMSDPHWSVITDDQFRAANIEQTQDRFFGLGNYDVQDYLATLKRCGLGGDILFDDKTCFELGCGVGRCTVWLSQFYKAIIAADISPSHLALARQSVARYRRDNVYFVHLDSFMTLEEKLPEFHSFFSIITLQHNPPPLIEWLLRRILRSLKPGGIAYFQVPTYSLNYSFKIKDYLNHALPIGEMEMHVLPQHRVFEILHQNGCRVLECREDWKTATRTFISNSILAIKES